MKMEISFLKIIYIRFNHPAINDRLAKFAKTKKWEVRNLNTIFQQTNILEPALFSPSDTTKKIDDFPEICVSTFSENIIQKFSSLDSTEKIAELYTANGVIPVYKIH